MDYTQGYDEYQSNEQTKHEPKSQEVESHRVGGELTAGTQGERHPQVEHGDVVQSHAARIGQIGLGVVDQE